MRKLIWLICLTACGSKRQTPAPNAPANALSVAEPVSFHGTTLADFDPTMPQVDALAYDVVTSVDATLGQEAYANQVTGVFVVTQAEPLAALDLDFTNDSDVTQGNVIEQVEAAVGHDDFTTASFTATATSITVTLPRVASYGHSFKVRIAYRGLVTQSPGASNVEWQTQGFMVSPSNTEGKRIFFSAGEPYFSRYWLPLRDHPRDGAMIALQATLPSAFYVVGNGTLEGTVHNGDGTTTWQYALLAPTPTYAFHLAAYDNWVEQRIDNDAGLDMYSFTYAKDAPNAPLLYGTIGQAFEFYRSLNGEFVWPELRFEETPATDMENTGSIDMTDGEIDADVGNSIGTAFHEMSHHWNGDDVRFATWNDVWLAEGFANYMMWRAVQHIYPEAEQKYWQISIAWEALASDMGPNTHVLRPPDPEVDGATMFDWVIYNKGASVVRMLEHWLGRPAFDTFLKAWFTQHRFEAVTTNDLLAFLKDMFPDKSAALDRFFSQWVTDFIYHPELAVDFATTGDATTVTVTQLQNAGPPDGFSFPLDVQFNDGAGQVATETMQVSGRTATASFTLPFTPVALVADPGDNLYADTICDASHACKDGYFCDPNGYFSSTQVNGAPLAVCVPYYGYCAYDYPGAGPQTWQTTTPAGDTWSLAMTYGPSPYGSQVESVAVSLNGALQSAAEFGDQDGLASIKSLSEAPGATVDGCVGTAGVYYVNFDSGCSSFALSAVFGGDSCASRSAFDGAVFTAQAAAAPALERLPAHRAKR